MSDLPERLNMLIGQYGLQCSETKELAPTMEFADALKEVADLHRELRLRRELTLYTHFAGEPRKSCIYCLASKSVHHPVAHNPDCPVKALEEMENSDE